jgi:integrase
LAEQLKAARKDALKAGERLPSWVFPNRNGELLDGDNLRKRVFAPILKKAILPHIRIHDLRHHAGSRIMPGRRVARPVTRVDLENVIADHPA